MATNVLRFEFLAADHFSPTADHVSRKLDTMGERLGAVGRTASFALGKVAVGGVAAFGFEMVKGVAAATAYQTLQLKTAAVIKSTGDVAHISVAGIDELAHKLQETSGVEEALIINSENVLATFTNIRNQTGKNNDIYNQATARILDLSVAMGEDLQSATVQVGKALNDPIKGMTALQRVGVTFNATQKEQIKHLASTGHLMAAQKIILGELGKEFGGAAKAAGSGFGGALSRLKLTLDDTFRDMATALLPALTSVANWLAERLPSAIAATAKGFSTLGGWLAFIGRNVGLPVYRALSSVLQALAARLTSLGKIVGPPIILFFKTLAMHLGTLAKVYGPQILLFFRSIGDRLSGLGKVAGPNVLAFFHGLVSVAGTVASALGGALATGIGILVHFFRDLLLPAMRDASAKVFPAIRGALDSVVAAFRDHQDVIRDFGKVFMFILKGIGIALAVLGLLIVKVVIPVIAELLVIILAAVGPIVRALLTIIGVLFNVIAGISSFVVIVAKIVARIVATLLGPWVTAGRWLFIVGKLIVTGLIEGITFIWPYVSSVISATIGRLLAPWKAAFSWLIPAGGALLRGLVGGAQNLWRMVTEFFSRRIDAIKAFFFPAGRWLTGPGANILRGLVFGLGSFFGVVSRAIGDFISTRIKGPFNSARTWLSKAGMRVLLGFLDGLQAIWSTITGWVGNIASWIRDHKGPISLDRKLLVPAGRAIMMGFYHGLVSGFGKSWDFVKSVGGKVVSELESALGMAGGMAVQGGGNSANRQLGQKMAAFYGWTGDQWAALNNLWMGESGWNNFARNPSSGAFGIPQALPPGKMGAAAAGGDAGAQIAWGLSYIRSVYGSPANAYAQWLSRSPHWYDEGGILNGKGLFGKNTSADERVLSPRQTRWFERAMQLGVRSGGGHGASGLTVILNAPNYVGSRDDLLDEFNRFARQGRLDSIVRMASR